MPLLRHTSRASCMALFVLRKLFYYRGCGWRPKRMTWSEEEQTWIGRIDQLLSDLFGPDYCDYEYTEKKHCVMVPGQFPLMKYDHDEWEKSYHFSDNSDGKPCLDHACKPGSDFDDNSVSNRDCQPSSNSVSNPDCKPISNPVSNHDCQPSSNPVSNRVCNPVNNPDNKPSSNPVSNRVCNPVSNPDCQPSSNPVSNRVCNPVNNPDCQPSSNPVSNCACNPKNNPDCKPSSNPVSNHACNPKSNPDCKPISNPASNHACNPVSNPDCKPISNPDTRPFSNPGSHSHCKPNDNPGYTCKTSSKLDCSNLKAGYKPDSKANGKVIPDIGSEDKENNSVEMKQGKKHLQANFRYNSMSHLTRGQRASLKLPKVVFVSPKEVHLVDSGSEVNDPHLLNMRPAENIVKEAMDMLTVHNNCRVSDGDDSSEALVRVGKLGTFTLASIKIFQNMCTLQSDAVKLQQERNWLSQE